MAKKKSGPPKKSPKRSSTPKAGVPPDPRAFEAMMRDMVGGMLGAREETPLDRAQALVYEAFDSPDAKQRAKLARKALDLSADCADAHVLLAEQAGGPKEAMEHYERAVAAGERAIGPEAFRDAVGHFWGLLETRPYMRARLGLADLLWSIGRRGDAVDHLRELLRLNPGDNQGVRYVLANRLLAQGLDDELVTLLGAYEEDSSNWAYSKALAAFRRDGDTLATRKLLKAARAVNAFVPDYLIGEAPLPIDQPGMYSLGSREEAILYARDALGAWRETPGATTWLREATAKKKRKLARPKSEGPLPLVKKRLEKVPKALDVWQADRRQFGPRIEERGELIVPWLTVVMSKTYDLILSQAMSLAAPAGAEVWDVIAAAIRSPAMGDPHRPTEIQVLPGEPWDELTPHLAEIGVGVVPVEELDLIDSMLAALEETLAGDDAPGLAGIAGVGPRELGGFYAAAADYYRSAPWRRVAPESAVRVESDKLADGPRFAVVMGQSAMTYGLALYDDLKTLRKLWKGNLSDEAGARETRALSVTYDTQIDTSDADLDAIGEHGLEIAGPEAYPSIFRKERGATIRDPLVWELELMEGVLRALPTFIDEHPPDDHAQHELTVPVASGPMRLVLSWIED